MVYSYLWGYANNRILAAQGAPQTAFMKKLTHDRTKLLHRVRRIRGQLDAIERTLENGEADECTAAMQLIAACRGAMDGLMAAVIDLHVREHMIDPDRNPKSSEAVATRELIDVVKAYLK